MIARYFNNAIAKSGFDKLEQREKVTVLSGILFLVCFVIIQFGITPFYEASKKLDRSIAKRKEDVVELQLLQQEYRSLRNEAGSLRDQINKRPATFTLFSFLDEQANRAEIKEFISYMKPSLTESDGELQESVVEMKLQKVTLTQLVDYLKLIESTVNVVSIKRISIQESGSEEGLLEVIMQIMTFVDNG